MTPNRRLDQLEPLMADALQKIDRLIEGQGQLVEVTTSIKAELDEVKGDLVEVKSDLTEVKGDLVSLNKIVSKVEATGQITANGLANLTISSQKQFEELKAGQEELRTNQQQLKIGQEELRVSQQQLKTDIGELKANQDLLKAGQDAIMNYLLEKLP
jgi:peptidoglycan hydrolase CwlO-like protein